MDEVVVVDQSLPDTGGITPTLDSIVWLVAAGILATFAGTCMASIYARRRSRRTRRGEVSHGGPAPAASIRGGFAPKVRLLCDFWNSRAFCSKSLSRSSLQIAQTRDSRQHLPRRNRKHHPLLPLLVAASFSCRARFHHLHCSHSVGSRLNRQGHFVATGNRLARRLFVVLEILPLFRRLLQKSTGDFVWRRVNSRGHHVGRRATNWTFRPTS